MNVTPGYHRRITAHISKAIILLRMDENYHLDKVIDGGKNTGITIEKGEYESCRFLNGDWGNADLSGSKFIDCEFTACNLSLATLTKTAFQDVQFTDCKLLGLHFEQCNSFGLSFRFERCQLNHCSFFGTKIKGTVFVGSQLIEVDFTDCDLANGVFQACDLSRAVFDNTILTRSDFRSAFHYSIDPDRNRIKGARFSLPDVVGLLDKYGIVVDGTA